MTRLLIASDLHLGGGASYGRSPGDRLRDQANIFEHVCSQAVERGVDGVVIPGDLFDKPKPTPAEYVAAMRGLRWLQVSRIPTLIVQGNHDVAGASDEVCALEVLAPFAKISKRPGVFNVGGVNVATLPWVSKSRMASLLDGSDVDAASRSVAERLVEVAAGMRADADVLALHWSLSGAVSSSGQSTDEFREVVLPTRELEAQGWDAIIAGHIHKAQPVGDVSWYVGSLCVCDFSEANDEHGFEIFDTDNIGREAVEVAQRRFVTLEPPDVSQAVDLAFPTPDYPLLEGAVVRVRYSCSEEERRRIDHAEIEAALYAAGAHRVHSIEATVTRETRARVKQATLDVNPAEALDSWIEYQAIEPPRAERMRVEAAAYRVAS